MHQEFFGVLAFGRFGFDAKKPICEAVGDLDFTANRLTAFDSIDPTEIIRYPSDP